MGIISSKATKPNICIITDGGKQIGMGHVQQSLTLAAELKNNTNIQFITKSNTTVCSVINKLGFHVTKLKNDIEIFEYLKKIGPTTIIFDKINVSKRLAKKIRTELPARLIIFTNLTDANRFAHVAVLPRAKDLTVDPGERFRNVVYTDIDTNTQYFYGPKYWVIRHEFIKYGELKKAPSENAKKIFLSFGGSDPTNLTCLAVKELLMLDNISHINIALGPEFSYHGELEKSLAAYPEKRNIVSVHCNVTDMAKLIYECDLAITAAGMTMFEVFCVGRPVIVIPQNQLQRDTYAGIVPMLEADQLNELAKMIIDADFLHPESSIIANMKIGQGLQELIDIINPA